MDGRTSSPLEVMILEPTVFSDDRGAFFETYNALPLSAATGFAAEFPQDYPSPSLKARMRGPHYPPPPYRTALRVRRCPSLKPLPWIVRRAQSVGTIPVLG